MEFNPIPPLKYIIGIRLSVPCRWFFIPMQTMKSFFAVCAAVLVVLPPSGYTAQADTDAQAKARKALREKMDEPGAPNQAERAPSYGAPYVDPNLPWPEAEKKGLKPKRVPPPVVQQPAPGSQPAEAVDFRRVPFVNGIVIVNSLEEYNADGVPLKSGLTVGTNSLLATPQFGKLADRFLAQPLDEPKMRELQRAIITYYRKHDRPLVDVLYPEQDVSNGMLQIILIEGRLKEVKVQDKRGSPYTNGWSGVKFLHDSIHLRTNDTIAESQIVKDLDWLNRNPFREVNAVYEPDNRVYGLSSVLLRVDERRQWSADVGYDDSGSPITSYNRITAGATWGKAFGLTDNQFRYAFTFDPTLELLRVHSASYYAPLPWHHGLRFSGYYLYDQGNVNQNNTLKGNSYQVSARYEVPLPAIGDYHHEASIGLDFKSSDNNVFYGVTQVQNTPTEIFQIAAGYSSALPDPWGRTSLSVQAYYSPGNVTDLNTDQAFNKSHEFAKAEYGYARFNLERSTRLPADFTWIIRGGAQVATGNLLASEQLGVGGYATVRGYDDLESLMDQGYFISNEIRTPPFSLLHLFSKASSLDDQLQLLGFVDYGRNGNVKLTFDETAHIELSSVGVGLRYSLTRHFALRFDYGWQLVTTGLGPKGQDSRGHIGVVATY